jgi:tripartite-type tricarboxylate transporter receptor subunit TctC
MKVVCVMLAALAAIATWSAPAWAQSDYPNKPVRLISGFAAGGSSDAIARSIAAALGNQLGQQVVVENRAGAAGKIGMDAVTNAAPDGYTIGLLAGTTLNALHFLNEPLDISRRFEPIGRFTSSRILLAVNPKVIDVHTLPEFVDYLKRHPGTALTSAGHGGLGHLGLELFAMEQGVKIMHVAYRGNGPAMNDVVAGQVGGLITEANFALPQVEAGRLRPIVTVSTERIPALPKLPTALELGYKSLQIDSTFGLTVPPRTPQAIIDRLRQALKQAVDSPEYVEFGNRSGNARYFQDAPAYRQWLAEDFARWGDVITKAKITRE